MPDTVTITIANHGGKRYEVDPRRPLLNTLEAQGVSLPYGCKYGGCITCAAKLLDGEINQAAAVALNNRQLNDGYILLCVARPLTDCTLDVGVESHDKLYRNPFASPLRPDELKPDIATPSPINSGENTMTTETVFHGPRRALQHRNTSAGILKSVKTIAMVGASPDPTKFSYGVLRVLHETGYDMIPVNPKEAGQRDSRPEGVRVAASDVDRPVDMVEVFRSSDALLGIAQDAVDIGAKVLWAQIGVRNDEAARLAESHGLKVVMNRCPKIELFRPFWKPRLNQTI